MMLVHIVCFSYVIKITQLMSHISEAPRRLSGYQRMKGEAPFILKKDFKRLEEVGDV